MPLKNRLLCPRWPADALHNHLSLSSYEPAHLAYQIPNHLALGWGRTDNTTETISEVVEKFWRLVRLDKEGKKNSLQGQSGKKKVEEIKPQLFQRAELSCAGEFTAEVCLLAGKKRKLRKNSGRKRLYMWGLRFCGFALFLVSLALPRSVIRNKCFYLNQYWFPALLPHMSKIFSVPWFVFWIPRQIKRLCCTRVAHK